jgi:signal transduction histidine kinase
VKDSTLPSNRIPFQYCALNDCLLALHAPIGVAMIAANGQILTANPALLEMLGSPSERATKEINVAAFPPLVAAGISADFLRCVATEAAVTAERPYTSKWGKRVYLRYHLTPVRQAFHQRPEARQSDAPLCTGTLSGAMDRTLDGSPSGQGKSVRHGDGLVVLALIEDLTAYRQTLDHLHRMQRMEALERMASGIAHDLNNYLTVIDGYVEVPPVSYGDADALQAIQEAVRRVTGLVHQLLSFSRQQTWHAVDVDLNELIGERSEIFRLLVGKEVEVDVRLAPSLSLVCVAPGYIGQVVDNLVSRARDVMPTGGRLTIETFDKEAFVCLRVSDTGPFLSDEKLTSQFEPYAGELGLGLAVVHGIVSQHGGHIEVEGGDGGTTFVVCLPAKGKTDEAHIG